MAKSRAEKEALLIEYKALLEGNSGFFAIDPKGIDAVTLTELKLKLKEQGTNMLIVKNSVFKIALTEANLPTDSTDFVEQTAVISYTEDPTVIAKMIQEVQKSSESFAAKFGVVEGKYLAADKVMELAEIPPREVLLARLLGSMNAPLTGFASVISGNVREFANVLQQLSEGKGTKSAAPVAEVAPAPVAAVVEEVAPEAKTEAAPAEEVAAEETEKSDSK